MFWIAIILLVYLNKFASLVKIEKQRSQHSLILFFEEIREQARFWFREPQTQRPHWKAEPYNLFENRINIVLSVIEVKKVPLKWGRDAPVKKAIWETMMSGLQRDLDPWPSLCRWFTNWAMKPCWGCIGNCDFIWTSESETVMRSSQPGSLLHLITIRFLVSCFVHILSQSNFCYTIHTDTSRAHLTRAWLTSCSSLARHIALTVRTTTCRLEQ